jgi:hypothetical protein
VSKRYYTQEEIAFIRVWVGRQSHAKIAQALGTTRDGLRRVIDRLNLRGRGLTRRKAVTA